MDVKAVSFRKAAALHYAVIAGHVDAVEVLIQNGADINAAM